MNSNDKISNIPSENQSQFLKTALVFTTFPYNTSSYSVNNSCAAISKGLPEPAKIKQMRRIIRRGIPPGITTFILSFYVTFQNTLQ
jgi:hypothetical protein